MAGLFANTAPSQRMRKVSTRAALMRAGEDAVAVAALECLDGIGDISTGGCAAVLEGAAAGLKSISDGTQVGVGVGLQVFGEVVDALGQDRHLDLRRPRVGVVEAVGGDGGGLVGHPVLVRPCW